jgi:hypothetical protein
LKNAIGGVLFLFSIFPRVAALLETAMLALFDFLVWGPDTWFASSPKLAGTPPGQRFPLTAFFITWVIGTAALLIANNSAVDKLGVRAAPPVERGLPHRFPRR